MQCCTTNLGKISLKITDKASIFDDLSVSKTHFTDKPAFSSDVSVNGRDFAKCSAAHRLLNHRVKGGFKFTDSRFSDISIIAVDCHSYAKPG